jgi:hypothetical protein
MLLKRVISGGQTGADRAGLIAAKAAGIPTGGWMPRGFIAYDGERPDFAELYGIAEVASDRYPPRTAKNVRESDGTLRFATNFDSPGELLTLKLCKAHGKPHLDVRPGGDIEPSDAVAWLCENEIRILNVAGNSEQTSPGIQDFVLGFLEEVFRTVVLATPAA